MKGMFEKVEVGPCFKKVGPGAIKFGNDCASLRLSLFNFSHAYVRDVLHAMFRRSQREEGSHPLQNS